ncbi:hypothetical protein [Desemzia sp. FAM 23991]|uniref:hypothetical protein n=1 Tax=unclassified Desemzia TaxID=2685243 RepID=UPI0038875B41
MPLVDVYVPINNSILVLVEEMKECLETKFLIQATQQEIIENAIVALKTQLN